VVSLCIPFHPPRPNLLPYAGPYAVNGVPLRRVNQAYVIATATKVDVAGVKLPAEVDDALFKAEAAKTTRGEADFFKLQGGKSTTSDARKALQTKVDGMLKLSAEVTAYMKSKFALRKGDKPHAMVF
jgi:large subunit ribosomal protein L6e